MTRPAPIQEKSSPLRVLAIDIEGGHGGSSRSLLQMLRAVDQMQASPEVWCRLGGAIEKAYESVNIPVKVMPDMPRLTALDRNSRNFVDAVRFFSKRWPQSRRFREQLADRLKSIDLLHLNHISLFWLARWVRRKFPDLQITMHIRTRPTNTVVARWQARVAAKACSRFVFITEKEQEHFTELLGYMPSGDVIYNPVEVSPLQARNGSGAESKGADRGLTAVCLSNYAYIRGLDRLIDVAKRLDDLSGQDVHFVVAGDMHLSRSLPGALGDIGRQGGTLADYAEQEGVAFRFSFPGHVAEPEALLMRADVLLKPTREKNPWGRDILEALGHGVPVASVGSYDTFVETGCTGLLQPEFDAQGLAEWLVSLSKNREALDNLRKNAAERIAVLCDPVRQAQSLVQFWQYAYRSNCSGKENVA